MTNITADTFRPESDSGAPSLVDIASWGTASQSSLSHWSTSNGAQEAVDGDFTRDFTIHTSINGSLPWWQLDLGEWFPVESIVVKNRRNASFWRRARSLLVEVSEDGTDWTLVHSGFVYFGSDDSNALRLPLAGTIPVRYVRLSLSEAEPLHLSQVQVLVTEDTARGRPIMRSLGVSFRSRARFSHGGLAPENYRVHAPHDREITGADGLRVVKYGRFANNVYQMARAVLLAESNDLDYVQMFESEIFDFTQDVQVFKPKILAACEDVPEDSVTVEGDYFYADRFKEGLRDPNDLTALPRAVRSHLRPYLSIHDAENPVAANELAIHIRSGDLFGPKPHPGYGQPPLSFYVWAVERAVDLGFESVRVVAEDRLNPVIDALEDYLTAISMPHTSQIGNDLQSDIATLLSARGLVFGVGTFGSAICMLSSTAEIVFEASNSSHFRAAFPDLLVHSAQPQTDYDPYVQWVNSADQREKMLSYPKSLLLVRGPGESEDSSPGDDREGLFERAPEAVSTAPAPSQVDSQPSDEKPAPAPQKDKNPNKIVVVHADGTRSEITKVDGLSIDFRGKGSVVEIGEGSVFVGSKLIIGHDSRVSIGTTHPRGLRNMVIDMGGQGRNKLLEIGADCSLESGRFAMVNESGTTVRIGRSCLMSSNLTFRATDGHAIFDQESGRVLNRTRPIVIGDHVWIGASATIVKGANIPNDTVIATQALVSKAFDESNTALAGNPARVVKRGIGWDRTYLTNYVEPEPPSGSGGNAPRSEP